MDRGHADVFIPNRADASHASSAHEVFVSRGHLSHVL